MASIDSLVTELQLELDDIERTFNTANHDSIVDEFPSPSVGKDIFEQHNVDSDKEGLLRMYLYSCVNNLS